MVGAFAQFVARDPAHLLGAVGDAVHEHEGVGVAIDVVAPIGAAAVVAVAAGLRDARPADEQPRAGDETLCDGVANADIAAAGVANGGKTAVEHRLDPGHGARRHLRQRHGLVLRGGEADREDMHMRVDQPREQGASFEIDHIGGDVLDRPVLDGLDAPVDHEDLKAGNGLVAMPVENEAVAEKGRGHLHLQKMISGASDRGCHAAGRRRC